MSTHLNQQNEPHLSELEGGNDHQHQTPEAEVEPVPVRQTGVRLPLQQLQNRVHDGHDPPR